MKIVLPTLPQSLVRFDSLKDGDAFFTEGGELAIRATRYGNANALVCLPSGEAALAEYQGYYMVEPCEVTITATRATQKPAAEDPALSTAERDLVDLDRKILAIKSYRERHGCGLKQAKDVVDAYTDLRAKTRGEALPNRW